MGQLVSMFPSIVGTLFLHVKLRTCEVTWIFVTHLAMKGHLDAIILDSLEALDVLFQQRDRMFKMSLKIQIVVWPPFLVTYVIQQASCVQGTQVSPPPWRFPGFSV